LSTTGTLRSFTIIQRAAPGVPVPYVSSVVELDGGGVVKANLLDAGTEPEKIDLGMKVRLTTFPCGRDEEGTEAVAFGFSPA
ncbi:MAG TPA: OB-fold domain-containing protein, partial [Acidimicrobiales bacterium]|nr:OB-fold domain-containing protein [Acidimicrobiales bacterium]